MENNYSNMYLPDRSFREDLKKLDPRLGCKYRLDIERFVITWDMSVGPCSELMVVRDERGGFRHPDKREINMLCEGDLHRTDLKDRLNKTEKYMANYREKQAAFEQDEIRNQTKDDKIQLMNTYRSVFNIGSKMGQFRRITPKVKGKTNDELQNCVAT